MTRHLLVLALVLACGHAFAERAVLLVEASKSEFTEYSTCSDDDCIPFYFWYIYEAKVKKVVAGEYDNSSIRFVHLQHGQFIDEILEHFYVVIDEIDDEEFTKLFGTNLVARDLTFPTTAVCFDEDMEQRFPDAEMFEFSYGELESRICYYEVDDSE